MSKHIFVTGGVVSALGKGITAASLGRLLKARGYKVMMQKADPYLNVDPGTMSPFQHGEVFVTDDGKETDLDLGHYERCINESLNADSNFTSGLIYQTLISRERAGDFLGGTVQVIPHVTNEIKARFAAVEETSGADVVITEIGGTVGDIEGQPFIEAMRQFRKEKGPGETIAIHVSLVPYIAAAHEIKTKPTQHSVKELRSMGIQPEIIVCRSDHEVEPAVRAKLASFCDVDESCVFQNLDCPSIYDVPRHLADQGFDLKVCELLGLEPRMRDMSPWYSFTGALHEASASWASTPPCPMRTSRSSRRSITRASTTAATWRSSSSTARTSIPRRWGRCSDATMASSFPADSASAASRARSPQPASPARARFPIWASASACRSPSQSSRAASAAWRAPRPPSSSPTAPIP